MTFVLSMLQIIYGTTHCSVIRLSLTPVSITLVQHRTQRHIACKALIDLIVLVERHLGPHAMLC